MNAKRPAGWKHSQEARAKISQSIIEARRGRAPATAEHHRAKIKTSLLINRLHDVGIGKVEASPTSVQACIALLKKVLPDLASVEMKATGATTTVIITGVVRHDDLVSSPSLPKPIDHIPSDCNRSASSSASPATPTEGQTSSASLIEKREGGGGE
jgi:hypothetical protein